MEIRDVGRDCFREFVREYVGYFLRGVGNLGFFDDFDLSKEMREVGREFVPECVGYFLRGIGNLGFF